MPPRAAGGPGPGLLAPFGALTSSWAGAACSLVLAAASTRTSCVATTSSRSARGGRCPLVSVPSASPRS
eukprot:4530654-Alexandrium_andersonii.AAC.1